jgi:hypothetical protein
MCEFLAAFLEDFSEDINEILLLEARNLTDDEMKNCHCIDSFYCPFYTFRILCLVVKYPKKHWRDRLIALANKYTVYKGLKTSFFFYSDRLHLLRNCPKFLEPASVIDVRDRRGSHWMRLENVVCNNNTSVTLHGNMIWYGSPFTVRIDFASEHGTVVTKNHEVIDPNDVKLLPHYLAHCVKQMQERTRNCFALHLLERTLDRMEDRNNGDNSSLRVFKYRLDRRLLTHQLRPFLVGKGRTIHKILL